MYICTIYAYIHIYMYVYIYIHICLCISLAGDVRNCLRWARQNLHEPEQVFKAFLFRLHACFRRVWRVSECRTLELGLVDMFASSSRAPLGIQGRDKQFQHQILTLLPANQTQRMPGYPVEARRGPLPFRYLRSIHPSNHPSIHLSVHLSIYPSIYLSIRVYLCVYIYNI